MTTAVQKKDEARIEEPTDQTEPTTNAETVAKKATKKKAAKKKAVSKKALSKAAKKKVAKKAVVKTESNIDDSPDTTSTGEAKRTDTGKRQRQIVYAHHLAERTFGGKKDSPVQKKKATRVTLKLTTRVAFRAAREAFIPTEEMIIRAIQALSQMHNRPAIGMLNAFMAHELNAITGRCGDIRQRIAGSIREVIDEYGFAIEPPENEVREVAIRITHPSHAHKAKVLKTIDDTCVDIETGRLVGAIPEDSAQELIREVINLCKSHRSKTSYLCKRIEKEARRPTGQFNLRALIQETNDQQARAAQQHQQQAKARQLQADRKPDPPVAAATTGAATEPQLAADEAAATNTNKKPPGKVTSLIEKALGRNSE